MAVRILGSVRRQLQGDSLSPMARHRSREAGSAGHKAGDAAGRVSEGVLRYGDSRAAILAAAGEKLSKFGPSAVLIGEICQQLGVSPSLVNYHFGNRDRLLAEAVVHEMEECVAEMNRVTYSVTDDPIAQLRARIEFRLGWTAAHPGIEAMTNYAFIMDPAGEILTGEMEERIGQVTASDLAGLHAALYGIFEGAARRGPTSQTELFAVPELIELTGHVALSVLGVMTWATGQHPSNRTVAEEQAEVSRNVQRTFVDRLIRHVVADIADIRSNYPR